MKALNSFIQKIRSPKNEYLATKIGSIAFIFGFLVYLVNKTLSSQNTFTSNISSKIGAAVFLFLLGLDGFVVMIREELQQSITIRGRSAKITGLLWCIFSWGLAAWYMVSLIFDITGQH